MQVEYIQLDCFSSLKNEIVTRMTKAYAQFGNHFKDLCIYLYSCSPVCYSERILGLPVAPKHITASLVMNGRVSCPISFYSCTKWAGMRLIFRTCCSVVVEALCYKPENRGIETRLCFFFLIYLLLPAALGLKTEMSRGSEMFLRSKARPVRKADNLIAM
jgi:hypothetical protein